MTEPFRPGCFGSPLCFKETHAVCIACPFAAECQTLGASRLEVLHKHYGVVSKSKKTSAPKPEPVKPKAMPAPKPIERRLMLIGRALRAGKNPFSPHQPSQRSFWLIVELMLKKPASATLKAFAVVVAKLMNSLKRALEHVQKVVRDLMRTGVVIQRGDLFVIQ